LLLIITAALDTSSFFVHGQNLESASSSFSKENGTSFASDNAISLDGSSLRNITLTKDQVFNVTITGGEVAITGMLPLTKTFYN
jgi:hypothetical protein